MKIREKVIDILCKTATGDRKVRNFLTPVGLIIFLGFIVLIIFLALTADRLLGLPRFWFQSWCRIISVPIIIMGLFMALWSILYFFRVKGTPVPFNPPPRLVMTGPYAYVRNPMLTGVFTMLFGLGVYSRSLSLLFVFTPLFIIFNYWELKMIEEPELQKRLGKAYMEYKSRTPMFIPHIKKQTK